MDTSMLDKVNETYIPFSTLKIQISREAIMSLGIMNEIDAFDYLEEWYGIDSKRIISASIENEATKQPILILKIKHK